MNGDQAAEAARGWHGFPVRPGDKRPAISAWEERACADPARLAQYWPSPHHNLGIACGPSGLVVIDLDPPDGVANLKALGRPVPPTLIVGTARPGGLHLYFAAIPGRPVRNSAGKIAPNIDVRAAGGYVVGPGSVIGGRAYEVIEDRPVVQLPGWLGDLLYQPRPAAAGPARVPLAQPEGAPGAAYARMRGVLDRLAAGRPGTGRNGLLHWCACRFAEMIAAGEIDSAAAEEALYLAAENNGHVAKHGERATRATIASGLRQGVSA